jgi:hypothetical protein
MISENNTVSQFSGWYKQYGVKIFLPAIRVMRSLEIENLKEVLLEEEKRNAATYPYNAVNHFLNFRW